MRMDYDPINDENKEFTLEEWVGITKESVDDYAAIVKPNLGKPTVPATRTYLQWARDFHQWMSW